MSALTDQWDCSIANLADAVNHLYVELPVLDHAKHYWVSKEKSTSCCTPMRVGSPAPTAN